MGSIYTSEGWFRVEHLNPVVLCSDLHIPGDPAWTNQTAEVEELSHSKSLLSPASFPPCPSPTSQLPFSAAWSELNEKWGWLTLWHWSRLSLWTCRYRIIIIIIIISRSKDKEGRTFSASLRDAEILDFFYKKTVDKNIYKATIIQKYVSYINEDCFRLSSLIR